jgi:hypothetical protein
MKAVPFVLAALLSGAVAHADPVDPYAGPPPAAQPRAPLRAALLERFDANHDGRLEPRERRHAIQTLRKLARNLARQQMRDARRAARLRGVIRRYDADGDGNVGPGEAPPAVQQRLRRLDRNRDGWVDDADFE